jgi:hypothetical protein
VGFYVCLIALGTSRRHPVIESDIFPTSKIWFSDCDQCWSTGSNGKKKIAVIPLDIDINASTKMFDAFIDHYRDKTEYIGFGYRYNTGRRFVECIASYDLETINILLDITEDTIANLRINPIPKAFVQTLNLPFIYPRFSIGRKLYYMVEIYGRSGILYRRWLSEQKIYAIPRVTTSTPIKQVEQIGI